MRCVIELPNRAALESDFAERLGSMTTRQRQRLRELMGNPPDPSNVPESFWVEVQREAEAQTLAALYLLFLESAAFHGGDRLSLDAQALDWARSRGAAVGQSYARTAREQFGQLARKLLVPERPAPPPIPGLPPVTPAETFTQQQLDDELAKIFGPSKAERIAVTETTAAQTAGGDAGVESTVGTSALDTWSVHPELTRTGPCPNCAALDGVTRDRWGLTPLPGEGHDGDPTLGPPLGPGCVLGGQTAVALGRTVAATKAVYHGLCVEVHLANRRRLTVTKNHPVLTPGGWVPAYRLRKGGDVMCCLDSEMVAGLVAPNEHNRESMIEQIFCSLRMACGSAVASMIAAPVAFHGDGRRINGDVDIVFAAGALLGDVESKILQPGGKLFFRRCDVRQSALTGQSLLASFLEACFAAAHRIVGGFDLRVALGSVQHLPSSLSGKRGTRAPHAGIFKSVLQSFSGNSQPSRQGLLGLASDVACNHCGKIWKRKPFGSTDPGLAHPNIEGHDTDSSVAREFCNRFASEVTSSKIIKVRRLRYCGHVYNLQVEPYHLFSVDGVIISNCACTTEYANLAT